MKRLLIAGFAALMLIPQTVSAYQQEDTQRLVFNQKHPVSNVEKLGVDYIYTYRSQIRSMADVTITQHKKCVMMKASPSGDFYAAAYKEKSDKIYFYSKYAGRKVKTLKLGQSGLQDICFSADGKTMYALFDNGRVNGYSILRTRNGKYISKFIQRSGWSIDNGYNQLTISPDSRFLAFWSGDRVYIWNLTTKSYETTLQQSEEIKKVKVSDSGELLGVLTASGVCTFYSTDFFMISGILDSMCPATDFAIHPKDTYVAFVDGTKNIVVINLLNPSDRQIVESPQDGTNFVSFCEDNSRTMYLVYTAPKAFIYDPLSCLTVNLVSQLKEELSLRMEEWEKQMPGESLSDYAIRVNEETRMEQIRLFETQIATEMAGNKVEMAEIRLGNYNAETNMLTLDFDSMESIYLTVPKSQLADFMDPASLKLENTQYCLNDDGRFQLVYTEVTNTTTGKKYVFNNLQRESLDFIESDENFMPLSVMQSSFLEEMKLESLKNEVVQQAKNNQFISDNTHIDVNTKVIPATEDGMLVMNYQVSVNYNVEEEFSAKEDFKPGQYQAEQSNAAKAMLSIAEKALTEDFAKYCVPGKTIRISITGSADATRVTGRIPYDGCYGELENVPVTVSDVPSYLTVTQTSGITSNEQLAFLRAYGVKEYLSKNIASLRNMNVEYNYSINVSSHEGSEYRRINVVFTFVNAF